MAVSPYMQQLDAALKASLRPYASILTEFQDRYADEPDKLTNMTHGFTRLLQFGWKDVSVSGLLSQDASNEENVKSYIDYFQSRKRSIQIAIDKHQVADELTPVEEAVNQCIAICEAAKAKCERGEVPLTEEPITIQLSTKLQEIALTPDEDGWYMTLLSTYPDEDERDESIREVIESVYEKIEKLPIALHARQAGMSDVQKSYLSMQAQLRRLASTYDLTMDDAETPLGRCASLVDACIQSCQNYARPYEEQRGAGGIE